ncbi:hypothetical protein [Streptomyces sp. NPDC058739]|uniref:hypothetical protein n=1 Tax=Streptomyces sp. NPDC058739 TaxID=3346618 RepID=UPI0036CE2E4E
MYERFQAAVTEAYSTVNTVHLEQHLHSVWLGKRRWQIPYRPWAAAEAGRSALVRLSGVQAELLQAYLDLRLVANPDPLQAADRVLDRMNEVLELDVGVAPAERFAATNQVAEAQREFVDVCRDDLWYLPRWWQVWRSVPAWWRSRRRSA